MTISELLRRAGSASPLVPALSYAGIVLLANLVVALLPNPLVAFLAVAMWLVSYVALFVIVTWYRDDDWLAAGFLFGITTTIADWVSLVVIGMLAERSLAVAVVYAPGAFLGVVIRAVITVPVAGGLVALARWISSRVRRRALPVAPPS